MGVVVLLVRAPPGELDRVPLAVPVQVSACRAGQRTGQLRARLRVQLGVALPQNLERRVAARLPARPRPSWTGHWIPGDYARDPVSDASVRGICSTADAAI